MAAKAEKTKSWGYFNIKCLKIKRALTRILSSSSFARQPKQGLWINGQRKRKTYIVNIDTLRKQTLFYLGKWRWGGPLVVLVGSQMNEFLIDLSLGCSLPSMTVMINQHHIGNAQYVVHVVWFEHSSKMLICGLDFGEVIFWSKIYYVVSIFFVHYPCGPHLAI